MNRKIFCIIKEQIISVIHVSGRTSVQVHPTRRLVNICHADLRRAAVVISVTPPPRFILLSVTDFQT